MAVIGTLTVIGTSTLVLHQTYIIAIRAPFFYHSTHKIIEASTSIEALGKGRQYDTKKSFLYSQVKSILTFTSGNRKESSKLAAAWRALRHVEIQIDQNAPAEMPPPMSYPDS